MSRSCAQPRRTSLHGLAVYEDGGRTASVTSGTRVGNRAPDARHPTLLTNLNLTDKETCYKVFRREVIQADRRSRRTRFGAEPEITAKIVKLQGA